MALGDPDPMAPWGWVPQQWMQPAPAADPLAQFPPPALAPEEFAAPVLPPPPEPAQPELPEIEMPPEYVGSVPLDPPPLPEEASGFDLMTGAPWQKVAEDAAPGQVGHMRTEFHPGQQSLSLDERARLSQTDPTAYAKFQIDETSHLEEKQQLAERQAELASLQEAEENLRIFKESQKKNDAEIQRALADADALANEKPAKFTDSVGNIIGSVIGVVLGAVGAPASGGKNMGVEAMMSAIDLHNKRERDQYERRSGAIGKRLNAYTQLREQGYNDYQAGEVIRIATLGRAKQVIALKAQDFDPHGTTARTLMAKYSTYDAAQRQAADAFNAANLKATREAEEHAAKQAKLAAETAKLEAEAIEKMRKGVGGGGSGSGKPDDQIIPAAELQRRFPEAAQFVTEDMSVNQLRQRMAVRKQAGDTTQSVGKETPEQERERTLGIGGIRNPDGSSLLASDVDSAKSLQKQKAAVDTINEFVGDIVRGIDEHGGADKYFSSSEWMTQTAKKAAIIQAARAGYEMGALDKGAVEEADKLFGATDPTSHWRNASKGFIAGRDAMVSRFNHALRSLPTHKGASYHPPDMTRGAAKSSKKEAVAKLLDWQTRQDAYGKDPDVIRSLGVPEVLIAETQRGYSRAQQSEADEYAAQAAAGNADAKMKLEGIAARALSPGFKAYAKAKLEALEPKAGTAAPGRSTDLTGVKFE
jgi:hypothetical protein